MTGVLWTMQILNYPLLALVGRPAFTRYEEAHDRRFFRSDRKHSLRALVPDRAGGRVEHCARQHAGSI